MNGTSEFACIVWQEKRKLLYYNVKVFLRDLWIKAMNHPLFKQRNIRGRYRRWRGISDLEIFTDRLLLN